MHGKSQSATAESFKKSIETMKYFALNLDNLAVELRREADRAQTLSNNLDRCKDAKFVIYCSRCKHYTSTLADGGHCLLSGLEVEKKDFCSKAEVRGDSLCWDCANASGKCSWSRDAKFIPVDGWDAVPVVAGSSDSYHVRNCPEFEEG